MPILGLNRTTASLLDSKAHCVLCIVVVIDTLDDSPRNALKQEFGFTDANPHLGLA